MVDIFVNSVEKKLSTIAKTNGINKMSEQLKRKRNLRLHLCYSCSKKLPAKDKRVFCISCREMKKIHNNRWRTKNQDYMKNWFRKNPEYMKSWLKKNPHYQKVYQAKRSKMLKSLERKNLRRLK